MCDDTAGKDVEIGKMRRTDVVIAGSGVAGLYCALNLPKDKKIVIVTKDGVDQNDSYLAQGGICV